MGQELGAAMQTGGITWSSKVSAQIRTGLKMTQVIRCPGGEREMVKEKASEMGLLRSALLGV